MECLSDIVGSDKPASDSQPTASTGQSATEAKCAPEITILIAYSDPVISAGLSRLLGEHSEFRLLRAETDRSCNRPPAPSDVAADIVIADYDPRWADLFQHRGHRGTAQ